MSRYPGQEFAQSSFLAGHPGHLMIDRLQIQIAPPKNSRAASRRNGFVSCHAEPYALGRALRILPYAGLHKPPNHSAPCARPPLLTPDPLHVVSHPLIKTHTAYISQRFSPIHF